MAKKTTKKKHSDDVVSEYDEYLAREKKQKNIKPEDLQVNEIGKGFYTMKEIVSFSMMQKKKKAMATTEED